MVVKSLLVISLVFVFAACSSEGRFKGKTVFDPQDVGTDQDSGAIIPPDDSLQNDPQPEPDSNVDMDLEEAFPEDARKYDQAWKRTDTALLLDCYQGNSINWDQVATDKRIVGVIHRATIGLRADVLYNQRKENAKRRNYLWGGYHLGDSSDPIVQANFYLKTIGDPASVLMVLDLEDVLNPKMMNAENARKFLAHVYQVTGRMPVVYTNHSSTLVLNEKMKNDTYFNNTKLWYARYREEIPKFPKGIWPSYFLWQFSSMANCSKTGSCLYNVPGTDRYIDVNVYYGSVAALRREWNPSPPQQPIP